MNTSDVLIEFLGDLVAPPRCAACGEEVRRNRAFCSGCAATIEPEESASLRMRVAAIGAYGGALAEAIQALKFGDRPDLARPLGKLLAQRSRPILEQADALLPIPLGAARLTERKYNQATLIARAMATVTRTEVIARGLSRTRETAAQANLERDARLVNVEGAFVARRRLDGLSVVLVDDVATTGATLRAAFLAAEQAGAKVLGAAVIAIAS